MIYCKFCENDKKENEFVPSQLKRNLPRCKFCIQKYNKNYKITNKEILSVKEKEFRKNNPEKIKEQEHQSYQRNRISKLEYKKSIYNNDKEFYAEKNKIYYKNNKEKISKKQLEYDKNRKKNDPEYKLRKNLSGSIGFYLKQNNSSKNRKSILKFLPYTIEELKAHIENLFESWMNWNNQGKYIPSEWNNDDQTTWKWQLDHIIPHSTFKYISMDSEEFRNCWALNNLRPYSAKQNIIDGATKIRHK